jgi:hypothetical protein
MVPTACPFCRAETKLANFIGGEHRFTMISLSGHCVIEQCFNFDTRLHDIAYMLSCVANDGALPPESYVMVRSATGKRLKADHRNCSEADLKPGERIRYHLSLRGD